MTHNEVWRVIRALALVDPKGTSVELTSLDRARIRDQYIEAFAEASALPLEEAFVLADAARMSS